MANANWSVQIGQCKMANANWSMQNGQWSVQSGVSALGKLTSCINSLNVYGAMNTFRN